MSKRKKNKPRKQKTKVAPPPQKSLLERFKWLGVLILVALTYFVFASVTENRFINYQDDVYIEDNSFLRDVSLEVFAASFLDNYQPLTILSLALNYQSANLAPALYHWTNLLLHLMNVVLVCYLLFLMSNRKPLVALIGALLFALHPMQVQAVAWLSARSVLLSGFFVLLSLIFYLKHREAQKPKWHVVAIFTYLFALFSSSAAILFPFLLLAVHYLKGGKIQTKMRLKWMPFWVISLGFLTLALIQKNIVLGTNGFLTSLMDSAYAFNLYLIKFFVPFNLAIFHPSPGVLSQPTLLYYASPILVLLFVGFLVWAFRKHRELVFGLLFFVVNIVWFLPLLQKSESIISESHVYIAYIGLAFLVGHSIQHYLQQKEESQQLIGKILLGGSLIGISIFAYVSNKRVTVWENDLSIWEDAIDKYPETSYVGYVHKGDYYRSQEKFKEALGFYNQSVKITPNYGEIYHRRALTHHHLNNLKEAEADYTKAIEYGSNQHMSYANLCKIHRMEGDYEQAMKECNLAIEGDDFKQKYKVYLQRGTMFALAKNFKKALADYNEYLQHDTSNGKAYRWRGIAYYEMGDLSKAMTDVQKALDLDANDAIAYLYRYRVHKARGNKEEARLDSIRAKNMGAPF